MNIPLVDLRAQYLAHQEEIDAAIKSVITTTAFIGGDAVRQFERKFAEIHGFREFIGCGNGTDALYVAMYALGIGAGHEVITTAHTWISTGETITQAGATPVFVDVDDYYTLDVSQVEARITPRTRAVIAVHLFGQSADMQPLVELCRRRRLLLIEDCAQAHFATCRGQLIGTFGDAATFSFYPGKNLGAYGDAGGMAFRDPKVAERARMYANHGALKKHDHLIEGINSRLDGLQAAVLGAKLPHVLDWTRARQAVSRWYDDALAGIPGIELPKRRAEASHVFHLYVIQTARRESLQAHLSKAGIQTAVHYPVALPFMPAYSRLGYTARDFPRAAANQDRILSLPIYPELTREGVQYVADQIARFMRPLSE